MGPYVEFGYAYGQMRRIWFYALGHCSKFCYALRATVVNFGYKLWANALNEASLYHAFSAFIVQYEK